MCKVHPNVGVEGGGAAKGSGNNCNPFTALASRFGCVRRSFFGHARYLLLHTRNTLEK